MANQDNFDTSSFSSFFNNDAGGNAARNNRRAPRRSQFERQSAFHRLSRFPDRFNAKPKLPSADNPNDPTPFATNYFKANPGLQDLSTPEEKLEALTQKLSDNPSMPTSERFTALSQQKTMRYLIYGDDSIEMLRSYVALGIFYNENRRYESAIRNLEQAQKLEKSHPLEKKDSFIVALELAEAHLSIENNKSKHASAASAALQPFKRFVEENSPGENTEEEEEKKDEKEKDEKEEEEEEAKEEEEKNKEEEKKKKDNSNRIDAVTKIRYDLAIARILAGKKDYEAAEEKFKEALDQYDQSHQDEPLGRLYVEIADTCDNANHKETAQEFYEKAFKIFDGLKLKEMAELVDNKIDDIKSQIQMAERRREQEEEEMNNNERDDDDDDDQTQSESSKQEKRAPRRYK